MEVKTMFSQRGAELLLVNGYKFSKVHISGEGKVRWRCSNRKCLAKIYTDRENEVIIDSNNVTIHNHEKSANLNREAVSNAVKRKATEDLYAKPSKLIHLQLRSDEFRNSQLTTNDLNCIRRNMYISRRSRVPPLPTEYLKNQKSVTIHEQCRKTYTRKSSIDASKKRQREGQEVSSYTASPPRTKSRVTESAFRFKEQCLFCGQELNEEYENKKSLKFRRRISQVGSTLQFIDSILEVARTRDDVAAKAVLARVEFEHDLVLDLVALEAKYHHDCYVSFLRPTTGAKIGRPEDEATDLAMEEIFTYIENSDDCQFTLNELKNVCKSTTLDNRTIKLRLKLKYGDKLIITEKLGASTFICLLANHHDIMKQARYEKEKMNKKEERFRVLDAAAAIIREDIQTSVFDNNSNYPPPSRTFEDLNNGIPESLTHFVERVILKQKRSNSDPSKLICTNICHIIMTEIREEEFENYDSDH